MDTLTHVFSSDLSLWGLFISSFLSATLLPGGSEAALFAVLKAYPETLWYALIIAAVGNTLGGMVTFGMGWLLPQRKGGSEAAGHPPAVSIPPNRRLEADCLPLVYFSRVQTQQLKHVEKVRPRHGGAEPSGAGVAASHLLMKRLAIRLGRHNSAAESLVIPQTAGFAITSDLASVVCSLSRMASSFISNVSKVRRYGTPALLLAWVPLIGDALCLAAGWLRLNPWQAMLFMAIGKLSRYGLIALAIT
jgi:membrane protein YqaA with SNARE-associated domain